MNSRPEFSEWSQLCERFKGFSRCRIYSQWTIIPRFRSNGVVPTPCWTTRTAKPRKKSATWYVEHAWNIGKRFCWSSCICFDTLCKNAQFLRLRRDGKHPSVSRHGATRCGKWRAKPRHHPYSEILRRPTAKDSFNPMEERSWRNFEADQQRLQVSQLHFGKFPSPQTLSCSMIRFETEVCSCSNFPTEAMPWINEVGKVNSVNDLKPSFSFQRCWGCRIGT